VSSPLPGLPPALRRLVADRPPRPTSVERCELCTEEIPDAHGHVVNLEARRLLCVCRACHLLFVTRGAARGRFLSVPDRYEALHGMWLDRAAWEALQIPVGMAFVLLNSNLGRAVALYPGPAGATESPLSPEAWADLVARQPRLASIAEDVEALLVRRRQATGESLFETCIVPIDVCYELVGRLRRSWRGFGGGAEAWREVDEFFARVRERCGIAARLPGAAT
jgi:hypothetical protein